MTTFWQDFTIADAFGLEAVKDTFERAFAEWRDDAEYLAELCIVANRKCWDWYHRGDGARSGFYADAYHACLDYAYSGALFEQDVRYFFEVTD